MIFILNIFRVYAEYWKLAIRCYILFYLGLLGIIQQFLFTNKFLSMKDCGLKLRTSHRGQILNFIQHSQWRFLVLYGFSKKLYQKESYKEEDKIFRSSRSIKFSCKVSTPLAPGIHLDSHIMQILNSDQQIPTLSRY